MCRPKTVPGCLFEISFKSGRRFTDGPIKKEEKEEEEKGLPVHTLANKLSHVTNEITFFQCAPELGAEGTHGRDTEIAQIVVFFCCRFFYQSARSASTAYAFCMHGEVQNKVYSQLGAA